MRAIKRLGANHRALIRRGANRRDHIVRPIDVSLPHDCKPLIRANTSFGKVRSEFPIVMSDTLPEANFNADTTQTKSPCTAERRYSRDEREVAISGEPRLSF